MKALAEKDSSILSSRGPGHPEAMTSVSQDTASSSAGKVTRSCIQVFNRDHCFYRQKVKYEAKKREEVLHKCTTSSIGKSIQEIIDASDNEVWKVNVADIIAEGNFLSRDIKYHKSCHTTHWRHYIKRSRRLSTDDDDGDADKANIECIAAEIEERLDDGEILTVKETSTLYNRIMHDHGIEERSLNYKAGVKKIQENIPNAVVTPGSGKNPTIIHSKKTDQSALDQAAQDRHIKEDMKLIFKCSKIIRQAILQSRKENQCSFDGSLIGCRKTGVPSELSNLIRWILHGVKVATTETHTEELHTTCTIIS